MVMSPMMMGPMMMSLVMMTLVIKSEKNKDLCSKQDDLHTTGSCSYVVHAAKKAKTNGCPVVFSVLYQILHTHKDGSVVNPVVKAKMMMFAKVIGKEHKGRIRGVGFGPNPSGRSSKSALTAIKIHSSQARDNEVAQLKASMTTVEEKLASFDEMKE
ncbi:hypothetical protein SO802_017614 [Lithocarpus litseifolius]|uniref:Uncharacterized protein n=1 Tax=Lithocarpus litseifolius TaxID=425828 RepID=A0AAW2CIH5_9ROSI